MLSGFGNRFGGEDVSVFDTETLVASSASLINIYVQSFTVGNGHLGNGPHGTARLARVDFGQGVQAADGNDFYILHGRAAGQAFVPNIHADMVYVEGYAAVIAHFDTEIEPSLAVDIDSREKRLQSVALVTDMFNLRLTEIYLLMGIIRRGVVDFSSVENSRFKSISIYLSPIYIIVNRTLFWLDIFQGFLRKCVANFAISGFRENGRQDLLFC